jgi:hypothetical protein
MTGDTEYSDGHMNTDVRGKTEAVNRVHPVRVSASS